MGAGVSCFDAPLAGPPFPLDLPLPVDTSGIGGGTSGRPSLGFFGDLFSGFGFFRGFFAAVSSSVRMDLLEAAV